MDQENVTYPEHLINTCIKINRQGGLSQFSECFYSIKIRLIFKFWREVVGYSTHFIRTFSSIEFY